MFLQRKIVILFLIFLKKIYMLREFIINIQMSTKNILQKMDTVKTEYLKFIILISQPKHMLWVLKRTVSMRRFF